MCGRFAITLPVDAVAQLFGAQPANDLPPEPRYNVCPTQPIAVVLHESPRPDGGADRNVAVPSGRHPVAVETNASPGDTLGPRRLMAVRWGFIPRWYKSPTDGPLLINARAETIATKPAFRNAARQRRCIIPATGFYEWTRLQDGERLPWFISRADGAPLAMAGVWRDWQGPEGERIRSAAIVTTQAGDDIAHIHHRQPVILDPQDWGLWLGEQGRGAARLMHAGPAGQLRAWRVDKAVNSNRAQGPELIRPIAGEPDPHDTAPRQGRA